jgi:hypothetical protein
MHLEALFAEFLRERKFLKNISPNTEKFYKQSWTAFNKYGNLEELNKGTLDKWVMAMREAGIKSKSATLLSRLSMRSNEGLLKQLIAPSDFQTKRFLEKVFFCD